MHCMAGTYLATTPHPQHSTAQLALRSTSSECRTILQPLVPLGTNGPTLD